MVQALGVSAAGVQLLDAACGTGRRLRAAHAASSVGIDLTPEMLPVAAGNEWYAAADVRALPLRNAAFDVVWCRLALGHVPDLPAAYLELARVCVAGGHVVVTDFHATAARAGHKRTFRDSGGNVYEIEHHVHTLDAHVNAAAAARLTMSDNAEAVVGPGVRDFYDRAGRLSAYEAQLGLPLVLGIVFSRQA
jgi:malonyl-CoA O-methyltransferase